MFQMPENDAAALMARIVASDYFNQASLRAGEKLPGHATMYERLGEGPSTVDERLSRQSLQPLEQHPAFVAELRRLIPGYRKGADLPALKASQ